MKVLELKIEGEECLRKKSEPVEFGAENKADLVELVSSMKALMLYEDGVGLAAPQIGINKRLFVIGVKGNPRYPQINSIPFSVFINPVIKKMSKRTSDFEEACLSVPDKRIILTRSRMIWAYWQDQWGRYHKSRLSGMLARIFLHEYDHLDGILISDYVDDLA